MRRFSVLVTAFVCLVVAMAPAGAAANRIALVIGNSAYENVPYLPNTKNDAAAMAGAFTRLGFDVIEANDLRANELRVKLTEFAIAAQKAEIATIFYAGHGIEVDGQNYIIPVDAKLKNVAVVGFELIPLDTIVASMETTKGLKLVFLDACRDNPFARTMRTTGTTRSIGRGLATVEPDAGMVISYAAKAGTVAYDGEGQHSPYTEALLRNIEEPGLELQFLFRRVRDEVLRKTSKRQEPFFYGSLPNREFYLQAPKPEPQVVAEPVAVAPVVKAAPQTTTARVGIDEAASAWSFVKDSTDPAMYEAFLADFGDVSQFYATLARKRLSDLTASSGPAAVAAAAKPVETASASAKAKRSSGAGNLLNSDTSDEAEKVYAMADPKSTAPSQLQPVVQPKGSKDKPASPPKVTPSLTIEPATTEVALAAPTEPVAPTLDPRALARETQTALNRLGCNAGPVDGAWGKRSRRALRAYARHAGVTLGSAEPSTEVLQQLRDRTGRICPVTCSVRQELRNGQCVAKTCPAGQKLSSKGVCYKERTKTARESCGAGQKRNSKGVCYTPRAATAKACPRGQRRNSKGVCYTPRTQAKSTRAATTAKKNTGKKKEVKYCREAYDMVPCDLSVHYRGN
ncbi:MAG: caspase family protein [Pseudomonadota bacterium]